MSVSTSKPSDRLLSYPKKTVRRAELALRCSPFRFRLFAAMRDRSIPLGAIAGSAGVESGYSQRDLTELAADNELVWAIQVGVLRREVDGQGITDSFRLTPLGRQIIARWERSGGTIPPAAWWESWQNWFYRWWRWPF